eukprot:COSAG02_NODE_18072_length_963_cov_0.711806_1_plen_114_part_00
MDSNGLLGGGLEQAKAGLWSGGPVVWAAGWGCCAVCSVEWEVIAMDDQVKGLLSGAGTHYQPCEPSHRTFLEFFLYLYGSPYARWTERQVETDGERERERESERESIRLYLCR